MVEMIRIHLSAILGEKRMTQTDLAEKTGVRVATINDLYHEFAVRVNLDDLEQICLVLDVDLHDLIELAPGMVRPVRQKKKKKKT